ncbi:MAG: hypothetical protein KUG71_06565 [Porticoccaceae bacterium]|nr:hypothetical protein [Porticoccaceae bacterium]
MNGFAGVLQNMESKIALTLVRCALQGLILFACVFLGDRGFAANEVHVLLSNDAPYYHQVAKVFTAQLKAQQPATEVRSIIMSDGVALPEILGQQIIAIGSEATTEALANYPQSDILSLLMPMAAWQDINKNTSIEGRFAAVVIDQPFERAVLLGLLLKPDARRFGAVFGPATQTTKTASLERVSSLGVELITASLPPTDNPISTLSPIINASEVFIAVPDRAVFNRNIAKWILHLSYREKIPVIGFSASYTKAGALASIYSSPTDIGRHGAELFVELSAHASDNAGKSWRAYYPKYYTLSINGDVARILNINLPPREDLYGMYQKLLQAM